MYIDEKIGGNWFLGYEVFVIFSFSVVAIISGTVKNTFSLITKA